MKKIFYIRMFISTFIFFPVWAIWINFHTKKNIFYRCICRSRQLQSRIRETIRFYCNCRSGKGRWPDLSSNNGQDYMRCYLQPTGVWHRRSSFYLAVG